MEKLQKKYGLFTGIAMVVGIVIGSGVFFKASKVLTNTDGKLSLALLAWFLGGMIMVISAYCFSIMATRVEKVNGVVDYIDVATNPKIGYTVGWYFTVVYYPILVGILSFLSLNYFYNLIGAGDFFGFLGQDGATGKIIVFVIFWALLIALSFVLNSFAPKLSGKWQVTTTVIKLIPIFVIAIIGSIIGLFKGNLDVAFASVATKEGVQNDFGKAILATIFAYEGWVCATSINAELKDSKKNLPKALVIGTIIVISCYLLYYLGLSLLIPETQEIIDAGNNAPIFAMEKLLGNFGKVLFNILIIVSCLGTLNGLTMSGARGMYALSARNQGPKIDEYNKLHVKSNMSLKSCLFGFLMSLVYVIVWLLIFTGKVPFGDIDELCIAFIYAAYIFVYIWIMKNCKELNKFKRYVMPIAAIVCSCFLIFAATGLFTYIQSGFTDYSRIANFFTFGGLAFGLTAAGMFFYSDKRQDKE